MKEDQLLEKAATIFKYKEVKIIEAAANFATNAHKGQRRASGEPFVRHPLAVAGILLDWGVDLNSVVAGILHDTLEDTHATIDDIREKFGEDVAFLVDGVTKVGRAHRGMRRIDEYLPATADNLTKLLIATGQDVRVLIIKLADRLHNLRTLSALPREKQKKIAMESLKIFGPLADRLTMGEAKREIEELAFSYSDPSEYNRLKKILKTRNGAGEKKMKTVLAEVEAALKKDHIKYEISGRTKSVYSLYKKLVKNPIDKIYDLSAMRIIVETVDECYRVLGILHRLFIPLEGRIKDYIAQPKPNGYQSLHTTVMTYDDNDAEFIVEFQIRTREMHEFAEHGLAASFHYNEAKLTDAYKKRAIAPLPDNLKWIQELQKIAIDIKNGRGGDVEKMKIKLFDDTIFVRSPKGDIYDLPAGSKPLDFAYRVHSDLGNTSAAFKINGKIADFDTELRDGDVVEIITRRNIRPRLDWIKKVFTPKARQKIKHQLKEDGVDVTRPKAPKRLKKKIKPTD